jgi:hypothetical protein
MREYSIKLKSELQAEFEYYFRLVNIDSTFVAFCSPPLNVNFFCIVSAARDTPSATFIVHCPSMIWVPLASMMASLVTEVSLVSVISCDGVL